MIVPLGALVAVLKEISARIAISIFARVENPRVIGRFGNNGAILGVYVENKLVEDLNQSSQLGLMTTISVFW